MHPSVCAEPLREFKFAWHGVAANGKLQRGTVVAQNLAAAQRTLRDSNIVALRIEPRGRAPQPRLSAPQVTQFSRQLAGLLHAGLPLLQALELIAGSHTQAAVKRLVGTIAADIARGIRFSAALSRYPKSFGTLYCQLLQLGEASGALTTVLTRLADERERVAAQQAKLRAALTYPLCVLLFAVALTAALMVFVVPAFQQIFAGVGAQLPAPTRIVLAISAIASRYAIPGAAGVLAGAVLFQAGLRRYSSWRDWLDRQALKPPVIGTLFTQLAVARWSRALATLLQAGTPLADAFDTLREASGNRVFDAATRQIGIQVRQGQRLAAAMASCRCFPGAVVQAIAVAEETGALAVMLADLAALHERQVEECIAKLSSLAEPVMIIVLGMLVGGLVVAMYLPIIQLGNAI